MERYMKQDPISIYEILDLLMDQFALPISLDTFRHYLTRQPNIKSVTGVAIDHKRAQINYHEIKNWYLELAEIIKTVPRNFIFNMDESGCDEYVDSKNVPVLVPNSHDGTHVDIPVHRQCKRATLTACIAADGSSMKPFVILPQETIDEEIFRAGYTRDKVAYFHHVHAFMTKAIFERWINTIFIPDLQQRRTRLKYDGPAILILDQFSGHSYEKFSEQCSANNIIVKYLVPHTSHLCQPLDLVTFALLKRSFNAIKSRQARTMQSNKLIKMMRAWHLSISVDSVISAFSAAGIVSQRYTSDSLYFCSIDLSLSIHLKGLDKMIEIQTQLTSAETTDASSAKPADSIEASKLSEHRPSLYPPLAKWVSEPLSRIPIDKAVEPAVSPKKSCKTQPEHLQNPTSTNGAAIMATQRQLTLNQTGCFQRSACTQGVTTPASCFTEQEAKDTRK
jgi:hypothetical protein